MGRSAKMHKRVPKKSTSQASQQSKPQATTQATPSVSQVKRKSNLRAKAQAEKSSKDPRSAHAKGESALGGVDYVALMMGGRRKAQEEVNKMIEE
ncbi:hypothetical protein JB92DRAFT_3110175 [Gautieria morchelliformis]|nr:hypothetical protein JB92DRAFT_3110175 [Gautieria morchelliformis]